MKGICAAVAAILSVCILSAAQGRTVDEPRVTAREAMATADRALVEIATEPAVIRAEKRGVSIQVPLSLRGSVVARIRVNPTSGAIMPAGYRVWTATAAVSAADAESTVRAALGVMRAGNPAQTANARWRVPLVLDDAVVAQVLVDGVSGTVLGERHAQARTKNNSHRSVR